MKNKSKLLCMALTAFFLIGIISTAFSSPAYALNIEVGTEIQQQGMNELNARLAINQYFAQREAFLKGNVETIAVAVSPMVSDELAHRNALALYNITLVDSSMTIDEISCGDKLAEAVITENAVFVVNGSEIQEEVEHTLC